MSAIFYKNLPYGAGGSNVEANPSGSSTGDLTKVGIDGTVYDVTDADAVHSSDKGVANGVASLDATGRVPSTQLPSYVDDVLEYASQSAFPATGESGKIYIALDTNKTYRWSGSAYVEISESLALGTTHSTAAYGDDAVSTAEPSFSEASTRANLAGSGEKLSVILGKIKKWFTDLKDLAFIGKDGASSTKYLRGDGTWTDELEGKNVIDDLIMTNSTNDSGIVIKAPAQDMSGLYLRINFPNHMMDDGDLCSHGYLSYLLGSLETTGFGNLAGINTDGTTSTKYLRGDGTWQTFPTIPTVNNKTLTIQKNGTQVAQFTANSASDVTANITVPTGDLASVNKPSSGQTTSYLRGDGTWQNFPSIPAAQVQSDWNQTNTSAVDYIKNKPTIPSGGVTGVKGDSESSYRTGNVNITKSNIGLGNVGNFKAVSTVASQGLSDTEKSNARANIGAGTSSFSGSYNDLSNKPTIPAAVAVKGNAESSYRTGNVNLTAENIGAIALSGTTALAGEITPKTNAAYNLGDLSHAFNYAHFKYLRLMGSNSSYVSTIKNSNDNQTTLVVPGRTTNPSTGSFYSEEKIATQEYLNTRIVIETKSVYADAQGYSNFGTKTNGVLVSAYPTSGTKYYGLIGENGSGTWYGYLFDWGSKVSSMTAGNNTCRLTWLIWS